MSASGRMRIARYFGMSEGFFLRLQVQFDLMEQKRKLGPKPAEIQPRVA